MKKKRIDKMGFIKNKNSCSSINSIKRVKGHFIKQEEKTAKYTVNGIYEEILEGRERLTI